MKNLKVRDKRGVGWHWADHRVITHFGRRLKPSGLAVYYALCAHAGEDEEKQKQGEVGKVWPSIDTLAELLGLSARTVRRQLARLEEMGLIYREYRPGRVSEIWLLKIPEAGRTEETGGTADLLETATHLLTDLGVEAGRAKRLASEAGLRAVFQEVHNLPAGLDNRAGYLVWRIQTGRHQFGPPGKPQNPVYNPQGLTFHIPYEERKRLVDELLGPGDGLAPGDVELVRQAFADHLRFKHRDTFDDD